MYWGLKWWAWAGIGSGFILVTLILTRVLYRAFVRVGELTEALGRAREGLDGAMAEVRDESELAREGLARLRSLKAEESEPPAAKPFGR